MKNCLQLVAAIIALSFCTNGNANGQEMTEKQFDRLEMRVCTQVTAPQLVELCLDRFESLYDDLAWIRTYKKVMRETKYDWEARTSLKWEQSTEYKKLQAQLENIRSKYDAKLSQIKDIYGLSSH